LRTSNNGSVNALPHADLRGVRVLVVEDHWHVAKALKSFLETEGMKVGGPVATTADARRLATEQKPDLAVVDIHLKLETAYVLIHQLDDLGVRVVVLSGLCRAAGADEEGRRRPAEALQRTGVARGFAPRAFALTWRIEGAVIV
jgi:CheY-like chemotaxis protein